MSTQPEALRLADALDCHEHIGMSKAAAELRRLHGENQELLRILEVIAHNGAIQEVAGFREWATRVAIAAIAKATRETS